MTGALLRTDLPGAVTRRQGKVRDIYDYGDGLLIVATDRISAFDVVMPNGIPRKGQILTDISLHWFRITEHLVRNHLLSADPEQFPEAVRPHGHLLAGRTMWVQKAEVVPVECVVRGYLAGSGWKEYQASGTVCGHKLPPGLPQSAQLPEPLFTPATKAESGHDENITVERAADLVGRETAEALAELSLALYRFGAEYALQRGFVLADTKFEFGRVDGRLVLIDEVMTPDSSRYWDAASYEPGRPQEAFDKQPVRDYLESTGWDKQPPAPPLPPELVQRVVAMYEETRRRIEGEPAARAGT